MGVGQHILDALETAGYALDTPRALAFGLLAGDPGARVGGRELLEKYGVLGPNQEGLDAGDVAGFGLEMALDPLNLVMGGGIVSKALKAKRAAAANKLSQAMRAAGAMPEELVSKLHPSMLENGIPKRWYHGTQEAFDKFDMERAGDGLVGKGAYLTDNPKIGSEYTTKAGSYGSTRSSDIRPRPGREDELLSLYDKHFEDADYPGRTREDAIKSALRRAERQTNPLPSHVAAFQDEALPLIDSHFTARRPANVRMHYLGIQNPLKLEHPGASALIDAERRAGESLMDFARRRGFDAVQHEGGNVVGTVKHNVSVVRDPSQIYSPYIAPALQAVPSLKRRTALLIAHNLLKRKRREQ